MKSRIGVQRIIPGAAELAVVAALLAAFLPASFAEEAAMRVFTDTEGREIAAKMISATKSAVTIETGDGKEFTVPQSKFGDADRKFITDWVKKNGLQIDYKFRIDANKKMVDRKLSSTGQAKVTAEAWAYTVSLRNESKTTLEGLELKYRLFKSDEHQGSGEKIEFTEGSTKLVPIKHTQEIQVETEPIMIYSTRLDGGYVYANGDRRSQHDGLEGVWLRLYHGGKMVAEEKPTGPKLKEKVWNEK